MSEYHAFTERKKVDAAAPRAFLRIALVADQKTGRDEMVVSGGDPYLQKRGEAKARVASAKALLQEAQDQLIIAKAAAQSDVDAVFVKAQEAWRTASSEYSNALNEFTRLLGPRFPPSNRFSSLR
jgi:hypothetical protein